MPSWRTKSWPRGRSRAAQLPLAGYRLAVARTHDARRAGRHGGARLRAEPSTVLRAAGARIEEIALAEIRRAGRHPGHRRLLGGRELRLAPGLARAPGRRLRPARACPHRARRGDEGARIHRTGACAQRMDRAHRSRAARFRRRAVAHRAHRCAADCPGRPAGGVDAAQDAARDEEFFRVNALLLRNPSVVNMLDGCAISIPCHAPGELPVGLMIWQGAMHDDAVLNIALQAQAALARTTGNS